MVGLGMEMGRVRGGLKDQGVETAKFRCMQGGRSWI